LKQIVAELGDGGFSVDDISILVAGTEAGREFALDRKTEIPESTAKGAGIGGLVGTGLGWLVGVASLAVPGVGPLLAAGPIAAALGGAAAGVVTGGLAGALLGMGLSDDEAEQYEGKVRDGSILISVHTDDPTESARARAILEGGGARHLSHNGNKTARDIAA